MSTSESPAARRVRIAVYVALVAAVVVVYAPVSRFWFLRWDDQLYVTENAHVLGGLTWANAWWALSAGVQPYWQPVTWLSHQLDISLFGMAGGLHHVTSLVLHAVSGVLLFEFLRRATGAFWRSAFVAAVFAVHPLHVESVAWVAERKDVLSTLFLNLTLLAYLRYVRKPAGRVGAYLFACALFAVALMAKPMVVTLPFLLLLVDIWPLCRVTFDSSEGWRAVLAEKVPFAALAAATGIITIVTQHAVGALANLHAIPLRVRLANAVTSYVLYIRAAVWPEGLAAFYPYEWDMRWYVPAGAVACLLAISAIALRWRRERPFVLVGWLWYMIALAPVIGLLQAGEQARADRFMYAPLIGLCLIVAWIVPSLAAALRPAVRRTLLATVSAAAIVALAVVARAQVMYWSDDVSLWRRTVSVTERNYLAYDLLGLAYRDRGHWAEALANYAIARQLAPSAMPDFAALVDYNSGVALVKQGRLDEGIEKFRSALHQKLDLFEAENDLAAALLMKGRRREAMLHFTTALQVRPNFAEAYSGLGAAQDLDGDKKQAEADYRRAIGLNPKLAIARANLAMLLVQQNKRDEAIDELRAALAVEPNHADWSYNAGALLASSGRVQEAIQHFNWALEVDPSYEPARQGLQRLGLRH